MNGAAVNIHPLYLLLGYLLLIFPVSFFLIFKIRLLKTLTVSLLRMTLQLLFVGVYLQVVFDLNTWWLNIVWLMVMVFAADISLITSAGFRWRRFLFPLFLSLLVGTVIPLLYFLGVIVRLPDVLDARYLIPVAGMIMGNSLRADIIGLKSFYTSIRSDEKTYSTYLSQGATHREALLPYLRDAYTAALSATLATMATVGLVSLPGMMTGIILGGTDPFIAIKYQIAIMIAIFSGTALTVMGAILLTVRFSFNRFGVLNRDIFSGSNLD
ncbi:MAG: ABC transporter permease [Candidatus Aminicenantes bacterium]|nr:ABC transporter permease [Candidatus Aminicenantes bacterium]